MSAIRDVFIIGGGLLAGVFVWQSWKADANRPMNESTVIGLAKTACRTRIQDQLNDPNSAEWNLSSWVAEVGENNNVRVYPDLRARNALGGMVRSQWLCEVTVDGTNRRITRLEPLN